MPFLLFFIFIPFIVFEVMNGARTLNICRNLEELTFGAQDAWRVGGILQQSDAEVHWDVLVYWWLVVLQIYNINNHLNINYNESLKKNVVVIVPFSFPILYHYSFPSEGMSECWGCK